MRRRSRKRRTWDTSSWARIDVLANAFGASLTLKPENAPYLGFAFGLPLADTSVNANDPRIAIDRSGEDSMRTELRVNYPADAASSCSTPSHSRSRSSTRWTSASRSRWSACTCSTGVHP